MLVDITVVIPFRNVAQWLANALDSVLKQEKGDLNVEVSLFDDGSTDGSESIAKEYLASFEKHNFACCFKSNSRAEAAGGVGYAKNQAARQGSGKFLCFLDADDEMLPGRLHQQYKAAVALPYSTIIGSKFRRLPLGSTGRYSRWANNIPLSVMPFQIYTSHGPPVVAPTWFLSRRLFEESIENWNNPVSSRRRISNLPLPLIVRFVTRCPHTLVSIYNMERRVTCMCDVDKRKVLRATYELYDQNNRAVVRRVPIISVGEAKPPFVICVKLDLTNGQLETLLTYATATLPRNSRHAFIFLLTVKTFFPEPVELPQTIDILAASPMSRNGNP
uniref:Glyco_trans_2-like domain-containing protein n=1 Tax=Trichuris muris TaxID=70415 RepID=A0A5S6QR42_TRIMR